MRPVNKGGSDAKYRYKDIDLSSQSTLETSLKAIDYTFDLKGGREPYDVFNTYGPTWLQMLRDCLLKYKTDSPSWGVKRDKKQSALQDMNNRIWNLVGGDKFGYRGATTPLVGKLGKFCSYCEQKLIDAPQLEHVAPEAEYPMFVLAWANFLLSCAVCNGKSNKTNKPYRNEVERWRPAPVNEIDFYDLIRNKYLWPDTQTTAYRDLIPKLEYLDETTSPIIWRRVPDAASVRFGTDLVTEDIVNRTIRRKIFLDMGTNKTEANVRVILEGQTDAARKSVELLGLNKDGKTTDTKKPEKTSDTRMFYRTQAWFNILINLNPLGMVSKTNWPDLWKGVIELAGSTAFFSLWVRILCLLDLEDPANPGTKLYTKFLLDTSGSFPNTDVSNIP
jgi:5-methylcytosine-specific restriction endonuclease McrA